MSSDLPPPGGGLYRYASQNSLDESSQRHIPRSSSGNVKSQVPFKSHDHSSKMFEQIHLLKKNDRFCDVTLVVENCEINAHKMILSACSPYFNAMFQSFEESKQNRICLQQIDSKALNLLIEFIYTSEILINEENVQMVLPAANLLQMTEVRDACCKFLQSQLDPSNCIGIRAFADMHSCIELYDHSDFYIRRYFPEVVQNDEFLSLTLQEVITLISSDHLSITNEELIFECVLNWIKSDKITREQYLGDLMQFVRFPLLPKEYLINRVEQEELLKLNLKCKDFIIEAFKYHLIKDEELMVFESPRTKPRLTTWSPKILLVVGGQSPKAIKNVEYYDFKEDKWHQMSEMPSRRCRSGLVVVNECVYLIGGFNGSIRVRCVDKYDPVLNTWTTCANMEARRSTLGVAVCNGLIYAIGGFDGAAGLSSAEMYDPKWNTWHSLPSMKTKRSSVGVGVVNEEIIAVGGYDGASRQCLSTVECFDPSDNIWYNLPEMHLKRSGAGVGVLNGILYAVGGHDGPSIRKSVEAYDSTTNLWKYVAEMNICRRNAGVVTLNDLLYVVGGDDGTCNLDSIEVYSPKTNTWTLLANKMSIGRSYAGVGVVEKPV